MPLSFTLITLNILQAFPNRHFACSKSKMETSFLNTSLINAFIFHTDHIEHFTGTSQPTFQSQPWKHQKNV